MSGIPFNIARGAASTLQMAPPFAFNDVTMSVFPLRAGLPRLEAFCRNYLNQAPHLVQFRPFIPFVYLVILDYGRMSLEAANMGWVSQREVAFGIPLRWLNADGDGLDFHDWAFTSPFIFVDNEMSMSTGREVYGWPKLLARLDPTVSEWVRDPHGNRRVFQVSTKRATQAYSGERRDYHTFLTVMQHRTAGLLDMPPSMDTIVKPVAQLSSAAVGVSRLSLDLLRAFTGLASDGITGTPVLPDMLDLETFRAQLRPDRLRDWVNPRKWTPGMRDVIWSVFPRLYSNTINFKQFRDARDPVAACYQAVTAAKMPVKAFKRGGLLGPQNMLLGQIDGGYRVDIHHLAGLPIVDSLGLEVSEERVTNGTTVSSLTPVCPFWLEVDMTYGLADTVVWRGRHGAWRRGDEPEDAPSHDRKNSSRALQHDLAAGEDTSDSKQEPEPTPETGPADDIETPGLDYIKAMNFFNTARGASQAVGGGFSMPNAGLRVLPLKADEKKLSEFVRNYLRVEKHMRFEAWGDFVYLIVAEFEHMTSDVNAISSTRAREVNVAVPVKCYEWFEDKEYPDEQSNPHEDYSDAGYAGWRQRRFLRGAERMVTTGFVVPFSFVDDVGNAITSSEVRGIPTVSAEISSPANDWLRLDHSKAQVHRSLLETSAQVLPALMAGAEAQKRTLIELHTHSPPGPEAHESEHVSVTRWIGLLADDLARKRDEMFFQTPEAPEGTSKTVEECFPQHQYHLDPTLFGRGFALKLLTGEYPLNQFSLKQFRDAKHTNDACYQGLVMNRHVIRNLRDLREIEDTIHLSITDYPTQPITEILGLIPKFSYPGKDRTVKVFEALRPFSMRADLYREAGVTLFERAGNEKWSPVDRPEQVFGRRSLSDQASFEKIIANAGVFDDNTTADLSYTWKPAGKTTSRPVVSAPVTKKFIKNVFAKHLANGEIRNLQINERFKFGKVSILSDPRFMDAIAAGKAPDLAGYSDQMRATGNESDFSAFELAGATEFVSPAMVADIVLSEQWGLAPGSRRRDYEKHWFCYRTDTIARGYGQSLFPSSERLDGTWPKTSVFHENQVRHRSSDILGFISEFWAVIDFLSVMVELSSAGFYGPDAEREMEDRLSQLQMIEQAPRSSRGRKKPPQRKDRMYTLARESVPESFWRDRMTVRLFEDPSKSPYQVRSSADWAKLRDGIARIFDFATTELDHEFDDEIVEFRDRWIKLAERSREDMAVIEHECGLQGQKNMEYFYLQHPEDILRRRLASLASGGLLGTD